MDREKMEQGIRTFLEGLGQRFEGDDLPATPERVARAWNEDLLSGYGVDPEAEITWTPVSPGGGPVLVRRISFASMCVHHLLPFFGFACVAYLPDRRQAGLSKIGRVIEAHSRRLQTQEHLGEVIVNTLHRSLEPRGVLTVLEAEHTCMTLRGVRKEQSRMLTTAASGIYESDAEARAEILQWLNTRPGTAGAFE